MSIKINIPNEANELIHKLQNAGFDTYIVGGCVRDSLMGIKPHDWDICTAATPEEVMNIFNDKHIIPTGLQHGTVTVMNHGEPFEITTFRVDGTYTDSRRPDHIDFTRSLKEDLKRRDFTMNAIAYNDKEGLVDPFFGIQDISNRLIRCVGNPVDRFHEDALRIMRCIRFASKLGFEIDKDTKEQIHLQKENLKNISMERIQGEFCKIALSDYFDEMLVAFEDVFEVFIPDIKPMVGFDQKNKYHIYDVWMHTCAAVYHLGIKRNHDLITKLAMFFHDISKPVCFQKDGDSLHFKGHGQVSADMTDKIMKDMKFDNETRERVVQLVFFHDATIEATPKAIKRWLNKMDPEQFTRFLEIREADTYAHNPEFTQEKLDKLDQIRRIFNEVMSSEACFSLKDLAINGNDIIDVLHIKPGKQVGALLNEVLDLVIDGKLKNDKNELLAFVSKGVKNEEENI